MDYDYSRSIPPSAVERVAAAPRLGACTRPGWSGRAIAQALGVTPGAVSQWLKRARAGGAQALVHRMPPGRVSRLSAEQRAAVGAPAGTGRRGPRLSGRRVDDQARRRRDQARVWRPLPSRAYESAPPGDRLECPEAAPPGHPAQRRGHHAVVDGALAGPSSKAQSERRTIVWVDEAGFYLLPGLVRTYAPRGQTPILWVPCTRDHLSVISGLTHDGPAPAPGPRARVSGPRGRPVPAASAAPDSGQAARDLGWGADPSRPARQGLPGAGGRGAPPVGATARATPRT